MIVLDHVAKTFVTRGGEEVVAMSDVSLEVGRNEFVCLVGPSGCGKSTLLRLVAGLVPPTGGTVSIGGAAVTEPRDDTGIVFQAPTLLPWASILDNVLFPLDMMGKLDAAGRERALRAGRLALDLPPDTRRGRPLRRDVPPARPDGAASATGKEPVRQ